MQQAAEREVLGDDEREGAGRDSEPDGDPEGPVPVVVSDAHGRDLEPQQRVRNGCHPQGGDEEADADDADRGGQAAPHGLAPAAYLGAEIERKARTDEEQGGAADPATDRVDARCRGETSRKMRQLDAAEREQERKLRHSHHEQGGERPADGGEHEEDDRDREQKL